MSIRTAPAMCTAGTIVFTCALGGCATTGGNSADTAVQQDAAVYDALRDELLAMRDEDQRIRKAFQAPDYSDPQLLDEMAAADRRHTARLKQIVDEHGWPTRSMVGDEAARAAWLLVQHADQDREFQRRCLALMEPSAQHGEVFPADVAYLTDRLLVADGKPQRYGTQFHNVDGKLVPRPIADRDHLDERRKRIGLMPFAEYEELMQS